MRACKLDTKLLLKITIAVFIFIFSLTNLSHAQKQPLIVAIEVLAPCVIKSNGSYTGFEIELWKQDLRGKLVATVAGTTSVDALVALGAKVVPVKIVDTAFEMLLKHEVDAVVFDSPTILHYARHVDDGSVAVIGDLFELQYYGFVFPQGSKLRESVNRNLLKIRKNGQYDRIFNKWFGSY